MAANATIASGEDADKDKGPNESEFLPHNLQCKVTDYDRLEATFTATFSSPPDILRESAQHDPKAADIQVANIEEGRISWEPDSLEVLQGVLTAKQALLGLSLHCIVAFALGLYSLVQVVRGDRALSAWFVIFSVLAIASTGGLLFLRFKQPRGQLAQGACVAVLPLAVFTVQLLAHLTCEVDLRVGEADVAALAVAVAHLAGSLVTNAELVACWPPLPLGLSLVLIAAHAAGKFLAAQGLDREVPSDVMHLRLIAPPFAVLAVAIMGQLLWRALDSAVEAVRKEQQQQKAMSNLLHRITSEKLRLEESMNRTQKRRSEMTRSMLDQKSTFRSGYDDVMTQVEELRDILTENRLLGPSELCKVDDVVEKVKHALMSDGLFKVKMDSAPRRRAGRAHTDLMTRTMTRMSFNSDWTTMIGLGDEHLPIRVSRQRTTTKNRMMRTVLDLFDICEEESPWKTRTSSMTLPGEISEPLGEPLTPGALTVPDRRNEKCKTTATCGYTGLEAFEGYEVGAAGEMSGDTSMISPRGSDSDVHLGEWGLDAYLLQRLTSGHALVHAGTFHGRILLQEAGIVGTESRQEKALKVFLSGIEEQYRPVPYHNSVHAADVLNSMMFLMKQHKQTNVRRPFTTVHKFAAYVAAVTHDAGHFGSNNRFHVMQHHPIAVLYNDSSPLENMHCAIGFLVLRQPAAAGFLQRPREREDAPEMTPSPSGAQPGGNCAYLTDEQFTDFRRIVIEAVLMTDMAKHFEATSRFRASIGYDEATGTCSSDAAVHDEPDIEHAAKAVGILLKTSDIGHTAKPLAITREMTRRIHQEFFTQGDQERQMGIPISPLCDRESANVPKSQVGFLQHLVFPLYNVIYAYLATDPIRDHCIHQLKVNMEWWQGLAEANS